MSETRKVRAVRQREPLRVPQQWRSEDRAFAIQLNQQLDEIYAKLGKIQGIAETIPTADEIERTSENTQTVEQALGIINPKKTNITSVPTDTYLLDFPFGVYQVNLSADSAYFPERWGTLVIDRSNVTYGVATFTSTSGNVYVRHMNGVSSWHNSWTPLEAAYDFGTHTVADIQDAIVNYATTLTNGALRTIKFSPSAVSGPFVITTYIGTLYKISNWRLVFEVYQSMNYERPIFGRYKEGTWEWNQCALYEDFPYIKGISQAHASSTATDLDSCMYAGAYLYNTSTAHAPSNYGICFVVASSDPTSTGIGWVFQLAFNCAGNQIFMRRRINNGTWSSWGYAKYFPTPFKTKTFTMDCDSTAIGGVGYCGEIQLSSTDIEDATFVIPQFARKSGYNYPLTVAYELGTLRLYSPAAITGVSVGVVLFYM